MERRNQPYGMGSPSNAPFQSYPWPHPHPYRHPHPYPHPHPHPHLHLHPHPHRAVLGVNGMLNPPLAPSHLQNQAPRMFNQAPQPALSPPPVYSSFHSPFAPGNPYHPPGQYYPHQTNNNAYGHGAPPDLSTNPMTHQWQPQPYHTMTRQPYHNPYSSAPPASRELPPPVSSNLLFGEAAQKKTVRQTRPCMICLETFDDTEHENHFPYKCPKCTTGHYCKGCLKDWFLSATQNESKMPPKCCSIVPLSAVNSLLSNDQIELYKAKFEEWATTDRLYCPVPQCSTFIPPRLYLETRKPPPAPASRQIRAVKIFDMLTSPASPPVEPKKAKPMKRHVLCPNCGCSVCTGCHRITHIGNCPESDLDPILEEQLKKWKIKRCPKCRAGVRKVFGCAHVECRCGAHFCFECLKPIVECDGGGCEDGSDEDVTENFEEDDLDGQAGFYEGDGHEFGPEPYGTVIDAWGCQHRWNELRVNEPRVLECNICFRRVHTLEIEKKPSRDPNEDIVMGGMEWPVNIYGQAAWRCFMGHISCENCSRYPSRFRATDPSWLWMCDCGKTCNQCQSGQALERFNSDRILADQRKHNDASVAWDCRCGMVICGDCKVAQTNL